MHPPESYQGRMYIKEHAILKRKATVPRHRLPVAANFLFSNLFTDIVLIPIKRRADNELLSNHRRPAIRTAATVTSGERCCYRRSSLFHDILSSPRTALTG